MRPRRRDAWNSILEDVERDKGRGPWRLSLRGALGFVLCLASAVGAVVAKLWVRCSPPGGCVKEHTNAHGRIYGPEVTASMYAVDLSAVQYELPMMVHTFVHMARDRATAHILTSTLHSDFYIVNILGTDFPEFV